MEVKLSDLKETKRPLNELEPYPAGKPMGFEDADKRFMVAVLVNGKVMKKHIVDKNVNLG